MRSAPTNQGRGDKQWLGAEESSKWRWSEHQSDGGIACDSSTWQFFFWSRDAGRATEKCFNLNPSGPKIATKCAILCVLFEIQLHDSPKIIQISKLKCPKKDSSGPGWANDQGFQQNGHLKEDTCRLCVTRSQFSTPKRRLRVRAIRDLNHRLGGRNGKSRNLPPAPDKSLGEHSKASEELTGLGWGDCWVTQKQWFAQGPARPPAVPPERIHRIDRKTTNKMKPTNPNADTYVDKQRQYLFVTFPTNSLVRHPEFTHWGDTLAWHYWATLAWHSCETLVRHFLLDTLVRHSYLTCL